MPTHSITLARASSQYLSAVDSTSLSQTGDQTHEGWMKWTTTPSSGSDMEIFDKYQGSVNGRAIAMTYENSGGTLRFHARTSADGSTVSEGTLNYTITTAVWSFFRFVYRASSGAIDVYVDDLTTKVGTITGLTTSIYDNTRPYQIGYNADIAGYIDAKIGMWRIWSNQHTTNDKCTLYGGSTSNMVAEWSLDSVLTDDSGNSNTLTNNGSASFSTDVTSTCVVAATFRGFFNMIAKA